MAIKWKNNKYKGILAVLLCVSLAGVIMCNLYPVFWLCELEKEGSEAGCGFVGDNCNITLNCFICSQ